MHNPENHTDQTSTAIQVAIARIRAISDSERRLAAAIDAAGKDVRPAKPTDDPSLHTQEDAFALPAPSRGPSAPVPR